IPPRDRRRRRGFNRGSLFLPSKKKGPGFASRLLPLRFEPYSAAGALPLAVFFGALTLVLVALGAAGTISNAGALSLIRTLTSPPLTSLPNSNSSASGCLIFSCTSRPIGRAP